MHHNKQEIQNPGLVIDLSGVKQTGECSVVVGSREYRFGVRYQAQHPHAVMITVEGKEIHFSCEAKGRIRTSGTTRVYVNDTLFDAARRVARKVFDLPPERRAELEMTHTHPADTGVGYARFLRFKAGQNAANDPKTENGDHNQ